MSLVWCSDVSLVSLNGQATLGAGVFCLDCGPRRPLHSQQGLFGTLLLARQRLELFPCTSPESGSPRMRYRVRKPKIAMSATPPIPSGPHPRGHRRRRRRRSEETGEGHLERARAREIVCVCEREREREREKERLQCDKNKHTHTHTPLWRPPSAPSYPRQTRFFVWRQAQKVAC